MIIVDFVDVRLTIRFANTYVSNFALSLARSRTLRDIFKTGDKDIKKGRATSCPAGGHWRGINHPREGLHFNARGWISNARASAGARSRARQPARLPMQLLGGFMQRARVEARCAGYRRCASLVTDAAGAYPASPCRTMPTTKRVVVAPRLMGPSFSFVPPPPILFIPF